MIIIIRRRHRTTTKTMMTTTMIMRMTMMMMMMMRMMMTMTIMMMTMIMVIIINHFKPKIPIADQWTLHQLTTTNTTSKYHVTLPGAAIEFWGWNYEETCYGMKSGVNALVVLICTALSLRLFSK